MTAPARDWAWAQDVSGGAKLVLLALAERSDVFGVTFAGQARIAAMTGLSGKTIGDQMAKLEGAGLVARFRRTRANGSRTSDWVVLAPLGARGQMEDHPADGRPDAIVEVARQGLGEETSPNVSSGNGPTQGEVLGGTLTVRTTEPTGLGSAQARKIPKISGRPVHGETWQRTIEALGAYNREAGQSVAPLTGAGEPSESAKRIYGRLREWPALTGPEVEAIIANTLRSRWWGQGPPSVGVVFGPKVWEGNMARGADGPVNREAARADRSARRRAALDRLANQRGVDLDQ